MIWHSQDTQSVLAELQTNAQSGLSTEEAAARLRTCGKNKINPAAKPAASFFLPYFFSKTSICLLVLAIVWIIAIAIWKISSFLEPVYLILFVLLKGIVLGSFAYIGHRGILSLCGGQKPTTTVLRDGGQREILCEELVPGDIVLLKKGDLIPADCRLLASHALHCNEGSLHGGHNVIEKTADILGIPDIAPLEQRQNMLYMGCAILDGTATAVVTDTGAATEISKQTRDTGSEDIAVLSVCGNVANLRRLAIFIDGVLCVILLIAGTLCGIFRDMAFWGNALFWLTTAACILSAFLPDKALPAGYLLCYCKLRQMRAHKITVNRFQTLDKLNDVSVICCDKTGSITKSDRMELQQVYDGTSISDVRELSETAARVLHLAALCCDGKVEQQGGKEKRSGDATQTAIISAALKQLKLTEEDLRVAYPRMCAIPFDRELKTMCTVNMIGGNNLAIVRGAPDKILPLCPHADAEAIQAVQSAMASRALRVIAVAVKPLEAAPANPTRTELECNLQFVGLLGLYNPPRPDAHAAVENCRKGGIKTVMLTGDGLENATAYAKSLGILTADTEALDAAALSEMTDTQLAENIHRYTVFSGVSSEDKVRIVQALQAAGHTVLMTGDAMEDIAALRTADVGCTPAGLGTDIAKHTSDLVVSGGLAAIAASIFHVRHLYHSIRSMYSLLCGLGISIFLFDLISAFTGEAFAFAQLLLCGLLAIAGLPLYFSFTRSASPAGEQANAVPLQSIAMAVAGVAAVVAGYLLPGDTPTLLLCALMAGYALLAYRISLARPVYKNLRYALRHLVPALGLIALLILLSCFATVIGFAPLTVTAWLLTILIALAGTAAYMITNRFLH